MNARDLRGPWRTNRHAGAAGYARAPSPDRSTHAVGSLGKPLSVAAVNLQAHRAFILDPTQNRSVERPLRLNQATAYRTAGTYPPRPAGP